jgi:hypothetical protein
MVSSIAAPAGFTYGWKEVYKGARSVKNLFATVHGADIMEMGNRELIYPLWKRKNTALCFNLYEIILYMKAFIN